MARLNCVSLGPVVALTQSQQLCCDRGGRMTDCGSGGVGVFVDHGVGIQQSEESVHEKNKREKEVGTNQ